MLWEKKWNKFHPTPQHQLEIIITKLSYLQKLKFKVIIKQSTAQKDVFHGSLQFILHNTRPDFCTRYFSVS
uniref:Uncharacterized protein n=1 Tax=Rhizophora mucronata TaxID=61149 RepID=A0A2P2LAF1_RHIMU